MSFCRRMASTSRARWWAAKAPASPCSRATLDLKHSPPHRRLVVLGFADAFIAADHVPFILDYPAHRPRRHRQHADRTLCSASAWRSMTSRCCRRGNSFLLVEFGASSEAEVEAQAEWFQVRGWQSSPAGRVLGCIPLRTQPASGLSASLLWARRSLSPASRTAGRDGKMPPCRRRNWAPICASSSR